MSVSLTGGVMDERAAETFRRRIKESQPWFPQVEALAEIDRLAEFSDRDLPNVLRSAVDAMSDHDFEVFRGTLILLSVAARARSADSDLMKAARYYSRGFPPCGGAAAQRDACFPRAVTWSHILPAVAGYPVVMASSRVL